MKRSLWIGILVLVLGGYAGFQQYSSWSLSKPQDKTVTQSEQGGTRGSGGGGQGRDVEALLPLLSGYLGHAKVSYTTHYLHLTPTLRQLGSERFAQMALPRLDHGGTLGDNE